MRAYTVSVQLNGKGAGTETRLHKLEAPQYASEKTSPDQRDPSGRAAQQEMRAYFTRNYTARRACIAKLH